MATLNVMTKTDVADLIPEKWARKVRLDARYKSFWDRFEGAEGSRKPFILRNDFIKEPGDLVHINVQSRLRNAGVTGETTLKGSEGKLTFSQFDVSVDWIRNAVSFTKKAKKEALLDLIIASNGALSDWLAQEKDSDSFTELLSTATPDTLYGGDATGRTTLDAGCRFGTTEIDRLRLALIRKRAIPISIVQTGKQQIPIYGIAISEMDEYNLKADAVWVKRNCEALVRGESNPLISGALGMYNGCLIYPHYGLAGDQGTPLRPEASVYSTHTAIVTTITVGDSTDGVDYTRYFDDAGTICIVNSDGSREFVTYTGKEDYSFTGCTRGATYGADGAAGGASAYTDGEIITQYNQITKQIGFGAEILARSWAMHPNPTTEVEDYGFELGIGVEAVWGNKAIEDSNGNKPNYLTMESFASNPNRGY